MDGADGAILDSQELFFGDVFDDLVEPLHEGEPFGGDGPAGFGGEFGEGFADLAGVFLDARLELSGELPAVEGGSADSHLSGDGGVGEFAVGDEARGDVFLDCPFPLLFHSFEADRKSKTPESVGRVS